MKRHAATLWQCDFYAKHVLTMKGRRDLYLLIVLHVESRQFYISPSTFHPNEEWVTEQAQAFPKYAKAGGVEVQTLMRDRDMKFELPFDAAFDSAGTKVKAGVYRAPNTNAYVERFIQTLQQDCLDHFVVFGEMHMDYLVREYVENYHEERPHQGIGNVLLSRRGEPENEDVDDEVTTLSMTDIRCKTRLGGILKSNCQAA